MKKQIITILFTTLILTGCFGGDDGTDPDNPLGPGSTLYEQTDFSVAIPQDWETIESSDFTSNIPAETVVGFRSNIKNEVFTANLSISKTALNEEISSEDFAKSNMKNAENSLLDFTEIASESIEIPYGSTELNGQILNFTGRKTATDPIVEFRQLFTVKDETGYTVTEGYLPSEDDTVVKYLDNMLNSFSLK